MKITINNEEVLCNKDFTINEEMLNTSSVILNNVYPKTWEQDKDYVSRFYYPKDYSKCKIFDEIEHPEEKEEVEGTSFSINVDTTKQYQVQTLKGQTSQSGTPTPTNPQPINITTGEQVVRVCGKNIFDGTQWKQGDLTTGNLGYRVTSTQALWLEAGTYTFSCNITSPFRYAIQGQIVGEIPLSTYPTLIFNSGWVTSTYPTKTFTLTQGMWIDVCMSKEDNSNLTISDISGFQYQIEKGSQATTYEAYNGTDYEINLGKNLVKSARVDSATSIYNVTLFVEADLEPSTTYTFSFNGTNGNRIYANENLFTTAPYISITNDRVVITLTTKDTISKSDTRQYNSSYQKWVIFKNGKNEDSANVYDNLMIEKGTQATSYAPYKTPIYLGKIGTYQDYIFRNTTENPLYDSNLEEGQWYIHKEIGKVVLDGSENWNVLGTNPNRYYTSAYSSELSGLSIEEALSNYFVFAGIIPNTNVNNRFFFNKSTGQTTSNGNLTIGYNEITSTNNLKTWLSTHNTEVYYVLATPTNTLIEDEELINQLNSIELLEGLNNVSVSSADLPFVMSLMYNYQEGYTEEELYFCGIVKNTGEISLNPRHPHYCNIQVLDFKDFLSQGETLDFVITDKTIGEAIDQVIGTIAPYGFIKGNILLDDVDELMGTYSTKDKTAYDVFNYIADITQSRWTTRMVDENTIAIDYFDPNKLPLGEQIEYNQTWFRNHKIDDLSYSYSSNDYRNKQVMLSGEVYSNIETTEILVADGYQTQFNTIDKIGKVSSLLLNGTPVSIITKEEYDLGYDADFYYQPGNKYFESVNLVSTGAILTIVYYAIIEGREVILNQDEISLIEERTGRKGVVARYETRNDATTTGELQSIGQSYIEYKGIPEIKLNVSSRENTWNIGDRVYFNAPLDELKQTYMVKAKKVQRITTIDELFYQYELTSSFNMEQDINYFDNQRYKSKGNIGEGEFISRNIDIENTANVIFYDLEVQEVEVEGNSTLQSELQSVLGGVE